MASVCIRLADLGDKQSVLNIRKDVFGGKDYIRTVYNSFVQLENSFPYVAVLNGEIVGFCVAFMVDDNMTTLIPRAARVRLEHTGKGIFKQLIKHIKDVHGRSALKYRFTTDYANQVVYSKTFKDEYNLLLTKDAVCFTEINHADLTKVLLHEIAEASDADLETYFTSKEHTAYLFPGDIVMIHWVPYSPTKSNVPIIRRSGNVAILSDVRMDEAGLKGILSIATFYQCSPGSYCCNIDIYGNDATSLEQHIKQQMGNLSDIPETVSIYTYGDITADKIQDAGKAIGLTETSANIFDTMYLYEIDL